MSTRKHRLSGAGAVTLAVLAVSAGIGAEAACTSCWNYQLCDYVPNGPICTHYDELNINDRCFGAASGWTQCSSGTNPQRRSYYLNGTDASDTGDRDCDGNTTENICIGGWPCGTETYENTVTWYGPGTTPCP